MPERELTEWETALFAAVNKTKQNDPEIETKLFQQSVVQQTKAFEAMKAVPGYPKYRLSLAENITEIIELLRSNTGESTPD